MLKRNTFSGIHLFLNQSFDLYAHKKYTLYSHLAHLFFASQIQILKQDDFYLLNNSLIYSPSVTASTLVRTELDKVLQNP